MALSKSSLKTKIENELIAGGIVISGEFAQASVLAEAIANAVVDEVNQNAKANITSGSSAGTYSIL